MDASAGKYYLLGATEGYVRDLVARGAAIIAANPLNTFRVATAARTCPIVITKPERELGADELVELAGEIRAHGGTVSFTSNNIDFIRRTATHITYSDGATYAGGWDEFIQYYKCTRLMSRMKSTFIPVVPFPPAPLANVSIVTTVLGVAVEVQTPFTIVLSGPLRRGAFYDLVGQVYRTCADVIGVYDDIALPDLLTAREFLAAKAAARANCAQLPPAHAAKCARFLDVFQVPAGPMMTMTRRDLSCISLTDAMAAPVFACIDPTKFLTIDQIYGMIEHLRYRNSIIVSDDTYFLGSLKSARVFHFKN